MRARGDADVHKTETIWDDRNVPHIFAHTDVGLFYAFGWAQARNHGNLLLRLYGQSRGRAAEYWGDPYLASDRRMALFDIWQRALRWRNQQSGPFLACLEAFAAGINAYARECPEQISAEAALVLPVDAVDVLAHSHRIVNIEFLIDPEALARSAAGEGRQGGSNAWCIAGSRTTSGYPLLLINPHLPWADFFRCFEAHLQLEDLAVYGITLVGIPVLMMAFNGALGWAHTVNPHQGWRLYELSQSQGGYRFDGTIQSFDQTTKDILVTESNGSVRKETFDVRRSIHGPVVAEYSGRAFALRLAGLDRPGCLEQWWAMACARTLSEFESALARMQVPTFSVLYADSEGHILHVFNGQIPIDPEVVGLNDSLAGDTSRTLWTRTLDYENLPRVLDPSSGFLQNANDPPWTTTFPGGPNPGDYPRYVAPAGPMSLRAQKSAKLILESNLLSHEAVIRAKYTTRMELADRVLDELISATRSLGTLLARKAADVLESWDRCAEPESVGAVLFVRWVQATGFDSLFREPWDPARPLATPCGLADPAAAVIALDAAASAVVEIYGALDVSWGDVYQFGVHELRFPALGADKVGSFCELWFLDVGDHRSVAIGGDTYTAVVEFSTPPRAWVNLITGNATQVQFGAATAGIRDHLSKQLRPALLQRDEIECHATALIRLTPVFGPSGD
nr:penicillin acylase family protein [Bradyrhizobium sp. 156]